MRLHLVHGGGGGEGGYATIPVLIVLEEFLDSCYHSTSVTGRRWDDGGHSSPPTPKF